MNKKKLYQLWTNGPRFLMILLFSVAVLGKFTNPSSFYIMVNALSPPIYTAEFLLSLLIVTETTMIMLLIFKPETGKILSAILLIIFTAVIVVLHTIGIRELCGCFGDSITSDIGPVKILQNIGLALLLLGSHTISGE
jgi:hypothetical protein